MAKQPANPLKTDQATEAEHQFHQSLDAMSPYYRRWDDYEAFHLSQTQTKLKNQGYTVSSVDDGRLSTLNFEASARVMAQNPTGSFQALTKADKGKSLLMQTVWDKYVTPNANAQFDLLTKYRLVNVESKMYGSKAVLYDWRIDEGYIGPDFWLIPMRSLFPQPGKTSIQDSDYLFVSTTRSVRWLKSRRGLEGWNKQALNYCIEQAEKAGKDPTNIRGGYRSFIERNRLFNTSAVTGDGALVEIVTKYEAGGKGQWVSFCPDFDWVELSRRDNPHQNGKIPVKLKHAFPLSDSFIGLGDYERGMTLQKARMSLVNMYLDSVKMGLMPPLLTIADKIAVPSSIQWQPTAKWQVKSADAVTPLQVSPQGLNTFEATFNTLTAALLNLQGTTDTTITQTSDQAFGRTPQALQQLQQREAARDNWDRFHMERFIAELTEDMANLFATKQATSVKVDGLFQQEIAELRLAYPEEDITGFLKPVKGPKPKMTMYDSEKSGSVTIPAGALAGTQYRFTIDPSSSLKKDQLTEYNNLKDFLSVVLPAYPVIAQALQQEGYTLSMGELLKRLLINASVDDQEKILSKQPDQQTAEGIPQIPGINAPNAPGHVGAPPPPMQPHNQFSDPQIAQIANQMFGSQGSGDAAVVPPNPMGGQP